MADYELPNNSYTNKDFQAIYEEMLEYARKLSLKWDPSQSNESDPGVVLIKELALFADKNNYNADKNLLEAFPSTVSQLGNARKLFEQLGYTMKWYRSGTSQISMHWTGDTDETVPALIGIPKFTMVSDDESNVVFTITDNKSLNTSENTLFNVIEGVATDYTVAGSKIVTVEHLDADNRIYFTERNIAENGIFICNVDDYDEPLLNYDEWNKVDNLSVEPYMYGETYNRIYKFGVLSDGNTCYIEFPDNAASIINYGINITYILSDGQSGNIRANTLSKFYNDVVVKDENNNDIILSGDNILISNYSAIDNGYEPESIEDAYRNYKRTIGTFNTLVSLRDYMNAINTSNIVSNGFVTDRTNDIQSSYHVVSNSSGTTRRLLRVVVDNKGAFEMNAFNLKMYLLDFVDKDSITGTIDYDNTFELVRNAATIDNDIYDVLDYISENKSIQHDFIPQQANKVCMIINEYPINCVIVPKHKITRAQEVEIQASIVANLCDNLNSQKVYFGTEIDYDIVYDIIINSNDLIKSVILNDLKYQSYAVYWDNGEAAYVRKLISTDMNDKQYFGVYDTVSNTFSDASKASDWEVGDRCLDIKTGNVYRCKSITLPDTPNWEFDKTTTIQDDIYSKSVLNGNTQLFVQDEDFDYTYTQEPSDVTVGEITAPIVEDVSSIETQSVIALNLSGGRGEYTLKPNENIILQSPNLVTKESYTVGVRYQYRLNDNIPSNANYKLKQNESICFYWTEEDSDTADYKYAFYGEGTVISPTFDLLKSNSATGPDDMYTVTAVPYVPSIMKILGNTFSSDYVSGGRIQDAYSNEFYTCKEFIRSKLSASKNNLSSTKYIEIKELNQKVLGIDENIGVNSFAECYWVLNKQTKVGDDEYEYVLFEKDANAFTQSYILKSNEYFMYTNADHSEFEILGPGTEITRYSSESTLDSAWSCKAISDSYQKILTDGVKILSTYWQSIPVGTTVTLTESLLYTLGEGATLHVSAYEWFEGGNALTKSSEVGLVGLSDFIIYGHIGKADDEEDPNYFYDVNDVQILLYDLCHIYFDTTTGYYYFAAATSSGALMKLMKATNSYVTLTVIKDNDGHKEKIPYTTYLAADSDKASAVQLSDLLPPYSRNYQGSIIYASESSGDYSCAFYQRDGIDECAITVPHPYEVVDDDVTLGDNEINEKTLSKYVNITGTTINGSNIQDIDDDTVIKSYLSTEYPPNAISTSVYYYTNDSKKYVRIWNSELNNKLNDITLLFYNDECRVRSDDNNHDSLSEFDLWYDYGGETVKIPQMLIQDGGWKGWSSLNLNLSNSHAQDLLEGHSFSIATENNAPVNLSSDYVWNKLSVSQSEVLANINVLYNTNDEDLYDKSTCLLVDNGVIKYWNDSIQTPSWNSLPGSGFVEIKSVAGGTVYVTSSNIESISDSDVAPGVNNYCAQVFVENSELQVKVCYKSVLNEKSNGVKSVLLNKEILADGPVIDTTETNIYDEKTYSKLYVYKYVENNETDENTQVKYNADGSIYVSADINEDLSAAIDFTVFKGDYIIPIDFGYLVSKATNLEIYTACCWFTDDEDRPIDVFDMTRGEIVQSAGQYAAIGKHYYKINVTDDKLKLRIHLGTTTLFNRYDVDGDGKITVADALDVLRAAAGLIGVDISKYDIDNDGKVTVADALEVLRVAARISAIPDSSAQIVIENLYRYVNPQLPLTADSIREKEDAAAEEGRTVDLKMSDNTLSTLVRNIARLNGTNGEFDFIYQVNPDEEIINPLDANSFFNKHHIYNPFTIGKMTTFVEGNNGKKESAIKIKVTQVQR